MNFGITASGSLWTSWDDVAWSYGMSVLDRAIRDAAASIEAYAAARRAKDPEVTKAQGQAIRRMLATAWVPLSRRSHGGRS